MMVIRTQFDDEDLMGKNQPTSYPSSLFDQAEGFVPNAVESFSSMIRRYQLGQFVATIPEGIGVDEQIFDDVMIEDFDVLDEQEQLIDQENERRKVDQKKSAAAQAASEPPTSEDNQ